MQVTSLSLCERVAEREKALFSDKFIELLQSQTLKAV